MTIDLAERSLDRAFDPIAAAALALPLIPRHRVLHRVPPIETWDLALPNGQTRRGLFLDVKSTGPAAYRDHIVELGLTSFEYDP